MLKLTKQDLKSIRTWLPADGMKLLADEFELKEVTIKGILYGSQKNNLVLRKALEMAADEKIKTEKAQKEIASSQN